MHLGGGRAEEDSTSVDMTHHPLFARACAPFNTVAAEACIRRPRTSARGCLRSNLLVAEWCISYLVWNSLHQTMPGQRCLHARARAGGVRLAI